MLIYIVSNIAGISETPMATDPLRLVLAFGNPTPDGDDGFYVGFTAENQAQLDRIMALPEPRKVTGPQDLWPGQALSCGPIQINGRMFPVLHIRTAWEYQ